MASDLPRDQSFDETQFGHSVVRLRIDGVMVEIVPRDEESPVAGAHRIHDTIHVISAGNPGFLDTAENNERRHTYMEHRLRDMGVEPFSAIGASPDGKWQEASWAVTGMTRQQACELGREFGQVAVFEIDFQRIHLVRCADLQVVSSRPYGVVEVSFGGS
ncbi:MAG: DUF3293 domain-containing protein [Actinomycetota bacterium]